MEKSSINVVDGLHEIISYIHAYDTESANYEGLISDHMSAIDKNY
jgi:hypothetical protein